LVQLTRGTIARTDLAKYRGTNGNRAVAEDLNLLTALLSKGFDTRDGKCGCDRAELEEAAELASQIITATGLQKASRSARTVGSERRLRGYSYLLKTYDQVRRAMTYLRWDHGDADLIAPSLYSFRKRKNAAAPKQPKTPSGDAAATATLGAKPPAATKKGRAKPALKRAAPGSEPFMQ
jgi:hypothetical protein